MAESIIRFQQAHHFHVLVLWVLGGEFMQILRAYSKRIEPLFQSVLPAEKTGRIVLSVSNTRHTLFHGVILGSSRLFFRYPLYNIDSAANMQRPLFNYCLVTA